MERLFSALLVATLCSCCFGNVLSFDGELHAKQALNVYDRSLYEDCSEVQRAGYSESGVYRLNVNERTVHLRCEFRDDGNAYTVFLQRVGGISYYRNWKEYKNGFGNLEADYWAGLETIHGLTKKANKTLNYLMEDWEGNKQNLNYSECNIEDERGNYTIHFGKYHGTLKYDDLSYHNNMPFITPDRPQSYCAKATKTGWWFNKCVLALPTGYHYNHPHYKPPGPVYNGVFYKDWLGWGYSLKAVSLALF